MQQFPAAVLVVLRNLMQQAVSLVPGSQVAIAGPGEGGNLERGVLIWLYHASPGLTLRRPGAKGAMGSAISTDLNVLLTCVGDERRYEPALLLGGVLATLEATSEINHTHVQDALSAIDGHGLDAHRLIKNWQNLPLSPHNVTVGELAQLWGMHGGSKGLSVACRIQAVPSGKAGGVEHA